VRDRGLSRGRRPRILLVAFHFPPGRGSAVFRNRAWANLLAAAGWDVTVLTTTRDWFQQATGGVDDDLAETIAPEVDVVRVPFSPQRYRPDLGSMSWLQANFTATYDRLTRELPERLFPERHALWYPAATAAGLAHVARRGRRPDLVMATGNPFASYAVARALGRALRTPYVLDFHDAWTLEQYAETEAFPPGHPAWAWEERVIRGAARVITVNRPFHDWYADRYPWAADRMRIAENGWATDVLTDMPAPVPAAEDRPLRFGYVGTIRHDLPLDVFAGGWRQARDRHPAMRGATFALHGHVGYFAKDADRITARLPTDTPGFELAGPVGHLDLARTFAGLDVLVALLPSTQYLTSAKIYDYAAALRPIVGVHHPRNPTSDVVTGHPWWFPLADLTADEVERALGEAAAAARSIRPDGDEVEAARAVAARHTWEAHLGPAIEDLSGLVRRG
jgi:glycosyltransferase involved in cell wall biosynthesis